MDKQDISKDIDSLVKKYKYSIRGLNEVQTDENGRKLIDEATKSFGIMYRELRKIIVNQDWAILELSLALDHEKRLKTENRLLKENLELSIKLDELAQNIKSMPIYIASKE